MGPLKPNLAELILGLVCFFLVFGLLGAVVLPRIERLLAAREDAIHGGARRAEAARAEAERIYAEYRAELDAARHEAARLRQEATEQGAAVLAELRAEGLRQREELVREARVQLAADRVIAEAGLREDLVELAGELAGRILGEPADPRLARAAADRFFAELDERAAA
jgi:F-type H+-transporting ATPase subunit b